MALCYQLLWFFPSEKICQFFLKLSPWLTHSNIWKFLLIYMEQNESYLCSGDWQWQVLWSQCQLEQTLSFREFSDKLQLINGLSKFCYLLKRSWEWGNLHKLMPYDSPLSKPLWAKPHCAIWAKIGINLGINSSLACLDSRIIALSMAIISSQLTSSVWTHIPNYEFLWCLWYV